MHLDERNSHFFSAIGSVAFHLLLLVAVVPSCVRENRVPQAYRLPVQMKYVTEPVQESSDERPVAESKELASTKKMAKPEVVGKPGRLPGDRDKPILTNEIRPIYPKVALNNEWEGTVEVEVFIDVDGKPQRITVLRSTGHIALDQAFIETIKSYYVFEPKREGGENLPSKLRLKHTFKLGD